MWSVVNNVCIVSENNEPIALVARREHSALIAAAPELLEAAQNIENDDGHIPPAIWQMLKAAISKAEVAKVQ